MASNHVYTEGRKLPRVPIMLIEKIDSETFLAKVFIF